MATIDPKTMERTAAGTRALDIMVRAGVPYRVREYQPAEPQRRLGGARSAQVTRDTGPP